MSAAGENTSRGRYATLGFDTERQRSDIEKQNIGNFTGQDRALNRRPDRDDFVGVDLTVGLFAEEVNDFLLHQWHAGHAADEQYIVDVIHSQAAVGEGSTHRL